MPRSTPPAPFPSSSASPSSTAASSSPRSSPARDPVAALHHARRGAAARARDQRDLATPARCPSSRCVNPLDEDVLLYDGEELVGAKQNRILNVTVLVGAGATLPIPVSCVEQGRWSSRVGVLRLGPARLARPPAPAQGGDARRPAARARRRAERGLGRDRATSPPGCTSPRRRCANSDVFEAHGDALGELEQAFPLQPGQCGAVLALGDDALPRLGLPPRRVRSACGRSSGAATCSTRSSGSTAAPTHRSRASPASSTRSPTPPSPADPPPVSARTCACAAPA